MISSERSQNIIVAFTIIAAVISSGFLASNVNYYTGSYDLISSMTVNVVKTEVHDIDPLNESIFPRIAFTFNMRTEANTEGNVRLTFIGAQVHLNDDHLTYLTFARVIPFEDQSLFTNYEKNFTLSERTGATDRETVLNAYSTDSWDWYLVFRFSFITFDQIDTLTVKYLEFNVTGTTNL
ncbi:MAG: hypothetical protein ACXACG_13060 [Candidatus Thorarchaeota archaeon]|jgi:hypothetical protein